MRRVSARAVPLATALVVFWAVSAVAAEPVELVVFHVADCPHCQAELAFLDGLDEHVPTLDVRALEVSASEPNLRRFYEAATEHGFEPSSVPVTILEDRVWIGFNEQNGREIEAAVLAAAGMETPMPPDDAVVVDLPLLGAVDVGDRSLVLATLAIGFVDGVNPCSLWVLMMLLSLVLRGGSRSRVALVGGVFLTVTALLYGVYMLGFYHAVAWMGATSWIRIAVALVVVVLGSIQLLDAIRPGLGPSLGIDTERRPGLFRRMRGLATGDMGTPAVIAGTAVLAVGVSLLETPCTAGLPVIWSDLVADRGVAGPGVVLLLAAYLAVFLLDEMVVFGAAVVTMRATKLQERQGRTLKVVSGVAMVVLGLAMLARPSLLGSVGGTLALTSAAAVAATAISVLLPRGHPAEGSAGRVSSRSGRARMLQVGRRRAHHA